MSQNTNAGDGQGVPPLVRNLVQNIDEEQLQSVATNLVENKAKPHFHDIRKRAEAADDVEEVREQMESLPEEKQNEMFHQTWQELVATLIEVRVRPLAGFRKLKTMLRDPATVEALLLIMDVDEIPESVREDQKDAIAQFLKYTGVALMPEAYSRSEVEDVYEQFGIDPELLEEFDYADTEDINEMID